jgi:hypothetical protein
MISANLFQKDFFRKLSDFHMDSSSQIVLQYGLLEDQVSNITIPVKFNSI